MKFKITSILIASLFLVLASCGDTSDKKENSSEQADTKKQAQIEKLMSEYTEASDALLIMLKSEAEHESKVQELYEKFMETEDEVLSDEIDRQIEALEAEGDEISEKVMDLMDPIIDLGDKIEELFDDLSKKQQKLYKETELKMEEAFSL